MLVAIFARALGIGVNSAIFNGVLLRSPIPLRPNEVVNVFTVRQNEPRLSPVLPHGISRTARAWGINGQPYTVIGITPDAL